MSWYSRERDAIIVHGASRFLKERLFEQSDAYTINICNKCGNIATTHKECNSCQTDEISKVNFPYAGKLVKDELCAMGLKLLIKSEK